MRNPTIHDVARYANVSIASVSRYLNDQSKVAPKSCQKIEDAIKTLGFIPNNIAQSLRSNHSNILGFIIRDVSNPNFAEVCKHAEIAARNHSLHIVLHNTFGNIDYEKESIDLLIRERTAGVALFNSKETINTADPLCKKHIPIVLIDSKIKGVNLPRVSSNAYKAVLEGTKYLLSLGHKRIGYLAGDLNLTTGKERFQGYIDALKDTDIKPIYLSGSFSKEDGYEQTLLLLSRVPKVTAIFPASNQLTLGCLLALKDNNVRIPNQVSILGFDNTDFSILHNPPVTIVNRRLDMLGSSSINLLIRLINKEPLPETAEIVLPVQIIYRNSCTRPKS